MAFHFVNPGDSIQAVIDAAAPGDTILIGSGVYNESLNVNKAITLQAFDTGGGPPIIEGPLLSQLGVPNGTALNDFFEANHPAYSASLGVSVSANNVTIDGLTFRGWSEAVALNTSDGVTLSDNTFIDNVTGIRKGTAAQVTNLTVNDNTFTQGIHGMTIYAAADDSGSFDGITMNNNSFSALSEKGMYFEQLSNAVFDGNIFDNVGNYGRVAPPFGSAAQNGEFGQAIDINLKYENYANVVFNNTTITNSGHSNQDGAGPNGLFGAAIGIKIRDDAPSYDGNPATFTGSIVFNGLTIDGTSTGVRIGEPGKNNLGPDVTLTDVTITNATVGDIDNATHATNGGTTSIALSAADTALDASASQADVDVAGNALANTIETGAGDDAVTGGGGADAINGGAGTDTAIYTQAIDASMLTANGADWTVTTGGAEGADTLAGVERIQSASGNMLLVGSGGYATIQEAIDAASAGDTIVVAAGVYAEDLIIDVAVTILGAQDGVAGTDGGRDAAGGVGETTIVGNSHITAAGAVTIDGVRFLNDATTTGGGPSNPTLQIQSGFDHVVTNSIFYSTVMGGANGVDDRAISLPVLTDGTITVSNNYIGGSQTGLFGTASWGRGLWFDGGGVDLVVTGNTIEFARTGINLDMSGDSTANITLNIVRSNGTAFSVGIDSDGVTLTDNDFENVGTDFNFRNLTTGVTFDAGAAIDALTPANPANPNNDAVVVLGGSGNDAITGTEGVDLLDGNNNPGNPNANDVDTLNGMGGDDFLFGRAGADNLNGGTGVDALDGGAGADALAGGDDADTLGGGDDNDTLDGGGGADAITGGAGTDTAIYTQAIDASMLTANGADWTVTTGGAEGADTLAGVERIQSASGNMLLVGSGGYATIQEAIDAASAGDTIVVAAGVYAEDLIIDVAVTILGAQDGVAGTDGGRDAAGGVGETTIIGNSHITAAGAVTIDGVRFLNDATTTGGGPSNPTLQIQSGFDHVITNSIFYSTVMGGANGVDDRAISLPVLTDGTITVSNNYIGGSQTGLFGTASWGRGLWFDGGGVDLVVTGNTIEFARTGINLDMSGDSTANITLNIVRSNGTAFSVGIDSDGVTLADNDFENVGTDFNFRNLTTGVTFDAGAAIDALTPANPANPNNDAVVVLGGSGNDAITGTEGVDLLDGNNNPGNPNANDLDVLNGMGGDDFLFGRAGADNLDGGEGNDTLTGGLGNDSIHGGGGNDIVSHVIGDGNDVIDGGADTDTVNIADGASGNILNVSYNGAALTNAVGATLTGVETVNADMGGGTDWLTYATIAAVTVNLGAGTASGFGLVTNIENVIGGSGNDTITGNGIDNRLDGGAGDDTLNGGGGIDILLGGDGADVLAGGLNNDALQGGIGNDTFNWVAGDGRDTFNGGADADTVNLTGAASAELGNATWNGSVLTAVMDNALVDIEAVNLDLGDGVDWLIYNTGFAVTVDLAANSASGFASVANIEKVIGGAGGDTLTGNELDNRLDGLGGDDVLNGGAGSDAVLGGDGADVIHASAGNDALQGQAGNDTFHWTAADGRDTFNGGADIDTVHLTGSAAGEVANANWNGSTITGLLNNALVSIETVHLDMGAGGAGGDWLRYNTGSAISVDLGAGTATGFASITNIENVIGGTGGDTIVGDGGANKINANNGDDTITGGAGNDNLIGGLGNDAFVYAPGAGADTINDFDAWDVGGQDLIDITTFGITAGDFGSRVAIIDTGADTVVRIDNDVFITLKNVTGDGDNAISIDDFILA